MGWSVRGEGWRVSCHHTYVYGLMLVPFFQVDPSVHMDPLSLPPVDPLLITELKAKLEYKHQYLAIKEGQLRQPHSHVAWE